MKVFIQNEAGSTTKHCHDEKTLELRERRTISHAYPFPYGFVIGTEAGDGCCVDCFVITQRPLVTGQVVECDVIGLMEQFEDGIVDHNVLARLPGERSDVDDDVRRALAEHVLACFAHVAGKQMRVGRFLGADAAEAHVIAHGA
jgi:inorganic pyrophosphatase